MNKSPQKQNEIKLDGSQLLGHNAQGIVMVAGTKPVGKKPLGKKQKVIKLDESKLLGHNAQGIVMAGQPKPSGTKMVAIKPIIGTKPSNPGPKPFAG